MRSLYIIMALVPIFGLCFATSDENVSACNCEHCNNEEKVIGLGEETTTQAWQVMYEEDSDDDGNRTICARNRDFNDRTFPSVCHMLCYNHCTRYRMVAVTKNDVKKYVVIAYRPNYYKLKDGLC
ncbi:uncharacterized protein LOC114937148 isoform X2 [Nylanderia fulva]|uniref:uncharacterized protein LOC114937148 isoform X1 n=1 Tax=Nylanderia fulva TaxID=613905 RepID=UPI0010FBAF9D|nr:uncharacterized protein LOC114937148 isoform X1 [Nylanderia fulva]XP_029166391.1 uncharacterized protein LOC114937148 isoform X2 [Nylanderia fulva]